MQRAVNQLILTQSSIDYNEEKTKTQGSKDKQQVKTA